MKRQQTIEGAMKQLQQTHKLSLNREPGQATDAHGTNGPPLSPELEKRVLAIGLRTYYREGLAQTKAELAPLLEELAASNAKRARVQLRPCRARTGASCPSVHLRLLNCW